MDQHSKNNYSLFEGETNQKKIASVHELMEVVDACNLRDRDKSLLATSVRVRSIDNFDDLYRKIEYYKLRNGTVDNMK